VEEGYRNRRRENTHPSLDLDEYVGTYTDAWYGNVRIGKNEEGSFNKFFC
jgi:hypothetical protein